MSDTTTTEQYDPTAYTVPEVTKYLKGADADERTRVIQAELARSDGKDPRKGITESADDDAKPETPRTAQQGTEKDQGFLGDTGATPEGTEPVKPAGESAPEGVSTDPQDGIVVPNGSPTLDLGTVPTVTDTPTPDLEGEAYQQGYLGTLPTDKDGNRPDLTLAAVTGQKS